MVQIPMSSNSSPQCNNSENVCQEKACDDVLQQDLTMLRGTQEPLHPFARLYDLDANTSSQVMLMLTRALRSSCALICPKFHLRITKSTNLQWTDIRLIMIQDHLPLQADYLEHVHFSTYGGDLLFFSLSKYTIPSFNKYCDVSDPVEHVRDF